MKQFGTPSGGLSSSKAFMFSVVLLVVATLLFATSMFVFVRDAAHDAKYLEYAGELRVLTHQVSTS